MNATHNSATRGVWSILMTQTNVSPEDLGDPDIRDSLEALWNRIDHHVRVTIRETDPEPVLQSKVRRTAARFVADFLQTVEGGRHE